MGGSRWARGLIAIQKASRSLRCSSRRSRKCLMPEFGRIAKSIGIFSKSSFSLRWGRVGRRSAAGLRSASVGVRGRPRLYFFYPTQPIFFSQKVCVIIQTVRRRNEEQPSIVESSFKCPVHFATPFEGCLLIEKQFPFSSTKKGEER